MSVSEIPQEEAGVLVTMGISSIAAAENSKVDGKTTIATMAVGVPMREHTLATELAVVALEVRRTQTPIPTAEARY